MSVGFKRQRSSTDDDNTRNNNVECFGCDEIHEIKSGNARLTRGAFGEVSIAIRRTKEKKTIPSSSSSSSPPNNDNGGDNDNEDAKLGGCEFVAIKTIDRAVVVLSTGEKQLDNVVFNEICALKYLSPHNNIVPLVAVYPSKSSPQSSLCLAFQYSPIDLQLVLEWRRRSFLPSLLFGVIKTIAKDMFSALKHCHSLGVLHRDVKPGNLLVSKSGVIQLCDFGLAKPITDRDKSILQPIPGESGTKGLCTLYYRPPEVLLGGAAKHPAVDLYSAGLVLAELTTGNAIFTGQNLLDQLAQVYDNLGTPTELTWPTVSELPDYGKLSFTKKNPRSWMEIAPRVVECPQFEDILSRCVVLDPQKRITSELALKHQWFQAKPELAGRGQMRRELIPPKLGEPILISPDNQNVASKVAMDVAKARREFLNSCLPEEVSWRDDVDLESMQDLMQLIDN